MSKFGLYGKITAQQGERDNLVAILLEAAASLQDDPDCDLYIVNVSPTEPDIIWVGGSLEQPGSPHGISRQGRC